MMTAQEALNLISAIHDNLELISATQVLTPMAEAAISRAKQQLKQLDVRETARAIEEASEQCHSD